jgi:hypothetical protein
MRRYLIPICCVSFATSVAAECSTLSGDAIKQAVTGAVLEVETPLGVRVPIRYFENGRVTGEARELAYILGSPTDSGRWWVSSDRLCHKWTKWFDGVLQCLRLSKKGSRIFWRRDDGETGVAVISTPARAVAKAPKNVVPPNSREAPEATGSLSASMGGVTVFPSRANSLPVTSSGDKEPELESQPVLVRRAEANPLPVGPANEARPAEVSPAEPSRANSDRPVQSFRVWGVASDDILNVRDGPSADYVATGAILPDAVGVSIVGECRDEWCPIYHRGITGWVNSLYLIEDKTVRGLERDQRGAGPDYQQ